MIEKIKRRKENNFTLSHAEQHHRKKGKDKNKRKQNNYFKDMEYIEAFPFTDSYYSNDYTSIKEIYEKINDGEEVKIFDIEIVKKVLTNKKFKNKVGSYQFDDGMVLEILTCFDDKKVFLIRKESL